MASPADPALLERLAALVASRRGARLFTLGISGAQGAGKSTIVAALAALLESRGLRVAALSLDDIYLTRTERLELARSVHPLFSTRGVPGTHDVPLGLATIDALAAGDPAPLPRFAKAEDDRAPAASWPLAPRDTQVLLLEGWCLGARAQDEAALAVPVNALEADEDPDATWRGHANRALAGPYRDLFARIDALVLLAAPGWEVVARWREEQEATLRATGGAGVMDEAQIRRFVAHYERLTRWILDEMPARADLVAHLGPAREVLGFTDPERAAPE